MKKSLFFLLAALFAVSTSSLAAVTIQNETGAKIVVRYHQCAAYKGVFKKSWCILEQKQVTVDKGKSKKITTIKYLRPINAPVGYQPAIAYIKATGEVIAPPKIDPIAFEISCKGYVFDGGVITFYKTEDVIASSYKCSLK